LSIFKKIEYNWHLIGLPAIIVGFLCYFFDAINHVDFWNFFWICPLVSIIAGFAVLFNSRFYMSSAIVWVLCGPFLAVIFSELKDNFQLWHFHHFFSIVVLIAILFHIKKVWCSEGFVFGLTSYYAYMMITSYLSNGEINFICRYFGKNNIILYLGILFVIFSIAMQITFWYNQKMIKK